MHNTKNTSSRLFFFARRAINIKRNMSPHTERIVSHIARTNTSRSARRPIHLRIVPYVYIFFSPRFSFCIESNHEEGAKASTCAVAECSPKRKGGVRHSHVCATELANSDVLVCRTSQDLPTFPERLEAVWRTGVFLKFCTRENRVLEFSFVLSTRIVCAFFFLSGIACSFIFYGSQMCK